MCINVACCADVTVTKPLLNFLQAHPVGIKQTGAAMAQVVETNTLHLVCYQKIREMLAQEIGSNPLSHRVYIDIVKIIVAIAFDADLPVLLLLLFHFIEHLLTGRDQGKCPAARPFFPDHKHICHRFRAEGSSRFPEASGSDIPIPAGRKPAASFQG